MTTVTMRTLLRRYWAFFRSRSKAIVVSLVNAVILTIGTYFMNNSPLWTRENLELYAGLDYFKGELVGRDYVNDSVLLINIAYDKQIAQKTINGLVVGNTDVADRKALLDLLNNLKSIDSTSGGNDSYRYIFLDILFEAGDVTDNDSLLFEAIGSTPRLVIANDKEKTLASSRLTPKAHYSDYQVTLTSTNFVRYQFLRNEGESMPLYAYHELYHDSISRHGWFYMSNGGLCQNTVAVRSVLDVNGTAIGDDDSPTRISTKPYYNLNKINDVATLAELARDRYVIVGNMIDDMHDTYYGTIPGPVIVFSTFWSLKNHEHLVKAWCVVLFFIIFFSISLSLFSRMPIIQRIAWIRNSKSKLFRFIITFLGYSTILFITTVMLFLCFGMVSSIWVPALFFSIQKTIFTYKNMTI